MRKLACSLAIASALMVAHRRAVVAVEGAERFDVAARLYARGEWSAAAEAFGDLLAGEPNHARAAEARFYCGEALAQLGRYLEARQQFAALADRYPQHRFARQALYRSGESAYLAGDDRAARRDLEAFRSRFEQDELNAYVLAYLGSLDLDAGESLHAKETYAQALERFPAGPLADECRLGLSRALELLNDREAARRGYQRLIDDRGPLAERALLHLGSMQNDAGNFAAALATLGRLATDYPQSPLQDKGRLGRGYALYKVGRVREAESLFAQLADHPQLGVEAEYWRGVAQADRGAWQQAADTLLAASRRETQHPLNPAIACRAAGALAQLGRTPAARDEYQRVLDQWPDSAWADDSLWGLLELSLRDGRHEDCLRQADELARRFPDSPLLARSASIQGQALYALGNYAPAARVLREYLGQEPARGGRDAAERSAAQATLALCHAKQGEFPAAAKVIADLRADRAPDKLVNETSKQVAEAAYAAGDLHTARDLFAGVKSSDGGLSGLAWSHFQAGDWTAAAEACDRLLAQIPHDPAAAEAAILRGRALEHLGQLDPALAMYRLAAERYPLSDRVAEALWRAGRLHDQLQQHSAALALYEKLIAEHGEFAELDAVLYRAAFLRQEAGGAAAAEALFARLRREFSTSRFAPDATLRLAELSIDRERYDEAERLLATLSGGGAASEVRQHAWLLEGRLAMARGQWDSVDPPLAKLVNDFPQSELAVVAAYLMAEASYQRGRYLEATERLGQLADNPRAREEPWLPAAELRRAQAWAQLKDWSQALEIAQSIETRFPGFDQQFEVDYLIGRACAARADFSAAREAYAKVLASPRGSQTATAAMARWMVGESYFHQEDYAQALAEYRKVDPQHRYPRWQAAALLQAGKCHELLHDWASAAESYERLLDAFPDSEFADEARRRAAAAHASAEEPSTKRKE